MAKMGSSWSYGFWIKTSLLSPTFWRVTFLTPTSVKSAVGLGMLASLSVTISFALSINDAILNSKPPRNQTSQQNSAGFTKTPTYLSKSTTNLNWVVSDTTAKPEDDASNLYQLKSWPPCRSRSEQKPHYPCNHFLEFAPLPTWQIAIVAEPANLK